MNAVDSGAATTRVTREGNPVRVCVFGAGAIGGVVAVKLAETGHDPLVVARGRVLEALRDGPAHCRDHGREYRQRLRVLSSDDTESAGVQDLLLIAVKAYHLAAAIPRLTPLIGPDTVVVPMLNGLPWWYCKGLLGPLAGRDLASIDPGGRIDKALPARQLVGCSVYIAASCPRPGHYLNVGPRTLVLGAVDPGSTALSGVASRALASAGFRVRESTDIRHAIWEKLWGNAFVNPVSVLTGALMNQLFADPRVSALGRAMVAEVCAVAAGSGVTVHTDIEARWRRWGAVEDFRTSMLQDFEQGRPIELETILGAVCELGRLTATATPTLDLIYALTRQKAELAGCYPDLL